MVSSVAQVDSQVIHISQPAVAISASEGIDHLTGKRVDEARDIWLIQVERGSEILL